MVCRYIVIVKNINRIVLQSPSTVASSFENDKTFIRKQATFHVRSCRFVSQTKYIQQISSFLLRSLSKTGSGCVVSRLLAQHIQLRLDALLGPGSALPFAIPVDLESTGTPLVFRNTSRGQNKALPGHGSPALT